MKNTPTTKNLIKGKDIVGLKVITLQKGQNIEDVDELIYDSKSDQIVALVVDPGGWFSDAKVILFKDIKTIGKDAIIVESDRVLKKASAVTEKISRIVKDDNYLTENTIITEDGTELGKVSDVYFQPTTGKVVELEVSQGLKDLQSGKKRVKVADIIKVGEDVTIVKAYVEEKMEEQANQQGAQGMFVHAKKTTQEKTPDLIETTKQKAQELSTKIQESFTDAKNDPRNRQRMEDLKTKTLEAKDTAVDKLKEGKDGASQKLQEGKDATQKRVEDTKAQTTERQKKDVIGKYVTINVLSVTDTLLARRGEMITNALLAQAEANGMLEQVLSNTSLEPVASPEPKQVKVPTEQINVDMQVSEKKEKKMTPHKAVTPEYT